MQTYKKTYLLLITLCLLTVGAIESLRLQASVTTDCVGKTYGTAGCPLKNTGTGAAIPATCGNGVLDTGEECDYGKLRNGITNCTTSCKLLYCGDGIISPQLNEECEPDTEEVYAIDPTTNTLTTEMHYLQASCGSVCTVPTCDAHGNCAGGCKRKFLPSCPVDQKTSGLTTFVASTGSSVSSLVSTKTSSVSSVASSTSVASSVVSSAEESASSVSSDVQTPVIPFQNSHCGDGILETARGEQCDDGANNSDLPNAHCRSNCMLPKCGDGVIDPSRGEQCDDGPNNANTANAHCRLDCSMPKCGDGVIDTAIGEQCDDGPNNSNTANAHCRLDCTLPKCGDGIVQPGEECDEGPNNTGDPNAHCRRDCTLPKCGDGVIDPSRGEQCDDGPNNSDAVGAHCRLNCLLPKCGDGIVQAGEQCDDGSKNSDTRSNACRMDCSAPRCGDGVTDANEQCDDGARNGKNGDKCSESCQILQPVASVTSSNTLPVTPIATGLASLGALTIVVYLLRKKIHGVVSKVAGEKAAKTIDDIPLDEIEMPWHNWN